MDEKTIYVDGDANFVSFHYRPWSEKNSVSVNDSSLINLSKDYDLVPKDQCAISNFNLKAEDPRDNGFWWVESVEKPNIDSVKLSVFA